MSNIQIVKKGLADDVVSAIQRTLKEPCWGFGFTSTDSNRPIWNFDKKKGEAVANIVKLAVPNNGLDFELLDWHINGQTFCQDGAPHDDTFFPGTTHAFVYFPFEWRHMWGGRLHILKRDQTAEIITPEQNTGVLFPADLIHYAEGPSTYATNKLRVSVSLKLRKLDK